MKNRIHWLDMAKGYGILFIMAGHLGIGKFGLILHSFHVPLFFFLSGYVFSGEKKNLDVFVKKKFKALIVPYFMYGVPLIIFQWLFTCTMRSICLNTLTVKRLHELVIELIVQNRFTTLWFLGTLFFLNLIFYFLVNYIKNKTVQKIIVFVITTGGVLYYNIGGKSLPWNIDICMTSLIFFYYGYNYKIDDRMNKAFLKFNVYIKIVVECTLTILCCFLSYCLSGKEFDMFGNNYGYPLIAFPTAFLGIASTISISKLVTIRLIEYIGKNSMIFFTWHQVIAFPLVLIFLTKVGFVWNESWTSLHIALYDVSVLLLSIMMLSCCNGIIKSTNKKIKNLMKIKL